MYSIFPQPTRVRHVLDLRLDMSNTGNIRVDSRLCFPAVPLDAGGRFDSIKFLEQSSPLSDSYPLTQLRPINTDYGVR
jgi:hypothetical protein